jgi:hypothetical protein
MERNGKKICQGTRRPELLFEFGLTKGFVLKLSDAETLSASFGQSLKAHELESVAALIRSFVEKNFASQSTQADSFGELAVQMGEVKFRSTRFSLLRSFSSLFQTFQVVKSPTKLMTDVTPLQTFEFTSVGFMRDAVLWVFGSSKEVFLSHDGTIAVEVSPGGPGAPETRYSFSTLMDDGRYRLTGTSVATEGLVYSMPSSMNFERDLQSHRAWISEQIEVHNTRPVAMNSMGDRKRVWRYYVRNLEARVTSLTVLGLVGLVFVLLGLVVSFIMESLH